MPVLPLQLMESVYESGYYVDTSISEKAETQQTPSNLPQTASLPDKSAVAGETDKNWQYCAVHGCDMTDEDTNTLKSSEESPPEVGIVSFPAAAKVCETSENSSLHEFNRLNDS